MQRHVVALGIVVSVGWWLGCAAPPVARPDPGALGRADAALLQGCYDCLLEARDDYRRLARGAPPLVIRVFEADLLLALREKELDLPPSDAIGEARGLARALPPDVEAARYLALTDDVPPEELGMPQRDLRTPFVMRDPRRLETDRAWLSRGRLRAPVRDYLQRALACVYAPAGAAVTPPEVPPLLAYRAEICGPGSMEGLAAVRARAPRFVETLLFTARIELGLIARDGPGQTRAHLDEVAARFPASPAIPYLIASFEAAIGDCAEALRFYDRTLALQPAHDRALLDRAVCLTTLGRAQDAVDAATRVIALGAATATEAYYWRARGHHALARLADARRDVSVAKAELASGEVLGLAGIIEYDQGDLDPAQADLAAAIAANPQDCTSRWYLGRVHRQRKQWLPSGRAFEDAMVCYRERARGSTARREALDGRGDLDAAYRAREVARLDASIAADRRQLHLAALTAASDDTLGGDAAAAQAMVEIASQDPALADRVAKLRTWIAGQPHPR